MTPRACVWAFPTTSKTPRLNGRSRLLAAVSFAVAAAACGGRATAPGAREAPSRVVTLAPNLTEIVFAIGAGSRLVGVSEYSDYPEAARQIPRVGGLDVSAERVVSLRPDLVLATPEGNARGPVNSLSAAGIPVLAVSTGSLDAVLDGIRLVGRSLGRGQAADRLAAELQKRREAARVRASRRDGRKPRAVLLIWPDPPQAAGGGTFLNDLVAEAGGENLLAEREGWPLVSPEWLATAGIDVLILPDSDQTRDSYERARSTGPLSRGTVAKARIVRIDEAVLTRPGPRVFDALETLEREIHR